MNTTCDYISLQECSSLSELFLIRAARSPDTTAYRFCNKISGNWHAVSWADMLRTVNQWRAALQQEQLTPGDRVALMLSNCTEWVLFEQASLSLGLVVVPLYANDRPDNIAYILENTGTKVLLCPGIAYWQHLSPVLNRLEGLQRVITIDFCQVRQDDPRITCITHWLPKDQESSKPFSPVVNDLASIVYTSGTTGPPKGVMLSHGNILGNSHAGLQCMDIYPGDTFLSFLPLSHMLERTAGYYMPMMAGATVAFARSVPDLPDDLLTIKPTVLVAVPRIFERVYSKLMTTLKSKPKPLKALFNHAVETGWSLFLHSQSRAPWAMGMLLNPLLDRLVGRKVRDRLGGRLRIIITGGAPLSADISKFFIGLGLPLYQGYGLTETSPVVCVNRQEDNRPDGVGKPLPGVEVKVGNGDELLVRGSCVMQGYWQNEEATARTIDLEGWLHTGDKVVIENGHIRITGRLKEIIVLSNGEKVAPADMEMAISLDPLFEHVLVLGEGRPFLSLLAVLNKGLWQELAAELGVRDEAQSLDLPEVRSVIFNRVEKLLADFPGFVFIKDVGLSLTPWTVDDGLLTPTLKLKRAAVERHMADDINRIYKP